jgi:hypothetical protein
MFIIILLLLSCNANTQDVPKFTNYYIMGTLNNAEIDEVSGMSASLNFPGILWVHNDSGGESKLYALDSTGKYLGHIKLEGVKNRDWEDMAIARHSKDGKSYIYVGEIGDNRSIYSSKFIYYFAEPETLPTESPFSVSISDFKTIEFNIENLSNHDSETLLVCPLTDEIYVITKRTDFAQLYSIPISQDREPVIAKFLTILKIGNDRTGSKVSRIVAGDISPKGDEILLKSYDSVYYFYRAENQSIAETLIQEPKSVPYLIEPQGEAISWTPSAHGYFTLSELSKTIKPVLYFYKRKD